MYYYIMNNAKNIKIGDNVILVDHEFFFGYDLDQEYKVIKIYQVPCMLGYNTTWFEVEYEEDNKVYNENFPLFAVEKA